MARTLNGELSPPVNASPLVRFALISAPVCAVSIVAPVAVHVLVAAAIVHVGLGTNEGDLIFNYVFGRVGIEQPAFLKGNAGVDAGAPSSGDAGGDDGACQCARRRRRAHESLFS